MRFTHRMSRLHTGAMRVLIGEIASGRYPEGELLPRELDLAERFDVSRNVARECVRGLEERGLVSVRHGRGAPRATGARMGPLRLRRARGAARRPARGGRARASTSSAGASSRWRPPGSQRSAPARPSSTALSEAFKRMRLTAEGARDNPAGERLYREADVAFHRAVVHAARQPGARAG